MAGGSGFVGTYLRRNLSEYFHFRGLTRSESRANAQPRQTHTEWVLCDLFSLPQVEKALEGVDFAIYLVHSMLPSSRLTQGNFADLDLLLADNFSRACRSAGVKHLIYLGGLIPEKDKNLSPHLASRLEVESILADSGIPLTVIRAGIIFGPGGSSAQMLVNLVRRLPVMILPKWTSSTTQGVDIDHITLALRKILENPKNFTGVFDLASHPLMTYEEMIKRTADFMEKPNRSIRFPFHFLALSRLWIALFSGVSPQLVTPLIQSLKHDLKVRPNSLLQELEREPFSFEESLRKSINPEKQPIQNPRRETQNRDNRMIRRARHVRSVQRLPLPLGWDAIRVAEEYGKWLSRKFIGILRVTRTREGILQFCFAFPKLLLLELSPSSRTTTGARQVFYITGGILAQPDKNPSARLEFRLVNQRTQVIAAIHGFVPSLPWYIYEQTQARVHLWVMRAFGKYLKKQPEIDLPESTISSQPSGE